MLCDEAVKRNLILCLNADGGDVFGSHCVFFGVFRHLFVNVSLGNGVYYSNKVADSVVVGVPAELYLALNSVAVGYSNVTHIVAEHRGLEVA